MEMNIRYAKKMGLALAGSFFWLAASASAQSTPAQSDERTMEDRDRDSATRQEFARFDQFLDSHREIGEQLRRNPTLVNDPQFLKDHPALQTYLQDHPRIATQLTDDPNTFMRGEKRYDRREDNGDMRRQEMARFDQFLDSHKNIDAQLRRDPSLINSEQFLKDHPELQSYLQDHPRTREAITQDPNGFMRSEERYDRREDQNMSRSSDRDRDLDRDADRDRGQRQQEAARFDQFLDSHREIAEQLRKNPALVNDAAFVKNHPELQSYLRQHPVVARNPDAFMHQETSYEHREPSDLSAARTDRDTSRYDGRDQSRYSGSKDTAGDQGRTMDSDRDRDAMTSRSASFGSFLGTHSAIAHQLSNNPSLANDQSYLQSHPELQSYLSTHPEVRNELMRNPQEFVKSAQQYNGTTKTSTPPAGAAPPPTATPSQPSQPHH